ncbi:XRE family transcriptional regulator [Sphingomonas glacialis]|uniref:XRE family transcriptional regulator n=2 Tax=Sphingomonas glacialis TaxID=658225 RepID=A0A502G595_9SPHN|nr:XRE family transcriptional regulator [Sphingomonas glacialis]
MREIRKGETVALDSALLEPKMLGSWVKIVRLTLKWSQDALAEASGLTVRTVQRVEAGERASLTTRRCLARGLGYENPDMFDDPAFAATVIQFYATVNVDQIKTEEDRHPDHLKLAVSPLETGVAVASLISACDAWVFHCDEDAPANAQSEAAGLFDLLQDYGDIWSDLTHSNRVDSQADFAPSLEALRLLGMRVYQATRAARLFGKDWVDPTPISTTVGYVTIVPIERDLSHILVPKRNGA